MTNVVAFEKPKPMKQAKPPAKKPRLTAEQRRSEWLAALAAIWANPKNWKRSKRGNAFIVIDDIDVCVVIFRRDDGCFQWQIRWRDGREPIKSRWIYEVEQTAIDEAWSAAMAVG